MKGFIVYLNSYCSWRLNWVSAYAIFTNMNFAWLWFTARLHIVYPMLFKLSSTKSDRNTHCGVLEFVADEGKIYLPYWVSNYMVILVNCVKLIKVVLTLNAEHQKKGEYFLLLATHNFVQKWKNLHGKHAIIPLLFLFMHRFFLFNLTHCFEKLSNISLSK